KWLIFTPSEVRAMGVATPAQALAVMGATHVLSGSVSRDPEALTVTGRLLNTRSSQPAASFQKMCPVDNAACLQEGLLQAAVGAFVPEGLSYKPAAPIAAEAFPYYSQGLFYLRR